MRLQVQHVRFDGNGDAGAYESLDITGIWDAKLSVSYSHASCLTFHMTAPQHTLPLVYNDFVRLWDEGALHPSGGTQSSSSPLFEGFVESITPGQDSNEVVVTCYDPTYRADKMIQVMSEPWEANGVLFPVPQSFSHPRVVYNVTIDNDDDYALALLLGATVGEVIALILGDHAKPLYYLNAAPGSGVIGGESQSYDTGELSALSLQPQGKFVAQSETVRSLITRLLQQYQPAHQLTWTPGDRKWHVKDTTAGTSRTITVNTISGTTYHSAVLSLDMVRSTEGRYGAVKFFGPHDIEWREAVANLTVVDNVITQDPEDTLQVVTDGVISINDEASEVPCINSLQIIDPDFTRVARKGPYAIDVPGPGLFWRGSDGGIIANLVTSYVQSWGWSLQILFSQGSGGDSYWQSVNGYYINIRTGEITLGNTCLYRIKSPPLGGDGSPELPLQIKFVYPALIDPLYVRWPANGYDGTLSSVAGIDNEWRLYDEDLSVYRDFGASVTTETRLLKFLDIAKQYHAKVKDIVVGGGFVTNGLDYDFAFLNRRVNISAKDDYGESITTGWEAINAVVTDVEYDFEQQTTTIQVNSDELELIGVDVDQMKQRLGIRAATPVNLFTPLVASFVSVGNAYGQSGAIGQSGNFATAFVDEFGNVQ